MQQESLTQSLLSGKGAPNLPDKELHIAHLSLPVLSDILKVMFIQYMYGWGGDGLKLLFPNLSVGKR